MDKFVKVRFGDRKIVSPDFNQANFFFHEIFYEDVYKLPKMQKSNPVIFDVGANVGVFTIFVKEKYPASSVFSFEPDVSNYFCLVRNTLMFDGVHPYNMAMADFCGLDVAFRDENCGIVSNENAPHKSVVQNVPFFCLSSFIQQVELVDFLKMDVEGFEGFILKDIKAYLNKVAAISMEYHDHISTMKSTEIEFTLKESGFMVDVIRTAYPWGIIHGRRPHE